jgi:S1-C subfamily serine protease
LYTTKVCPRCQARNTLGERTCRQCGYTFTTLMPPSTGKLTGKLTGRRLPWLLIVLGLATAAVLVGLGQFWWQSREEAGAAGVSQPATAPAVSPLGNAMQATVQILTPDDSASGSYSAGSGSVVDPAGYILTNFHVIGDPDSGGLYNARGLIWIGVSPDGSTQPPEVLYRAELVEADRELDLALLRIVATDGGGDLPADLGLGVLPIGDSDSVQIGDTITVLGYPGIGGDTLTVTRGGVAGFLPGWIKTDAETNHGNSGGAAINAAGELVGVPTAGNSEAGDSERLPGKIGLIRPINLAQSLLEKIER